MQKQALTDVGASTLRASLDVSGILKREAFAPLPDVVEWARQAVYIGASQGTANPGYYDVALTPYMAEPLRAMCDESTRRVVLMTGAQVGKTQTELVATMYRLEYLPGPMMVVMPASDEAEEFANTRLKPTITDSPALEHLVPHDQRKNFGKKNLHLPGSLVHMRGAGAPSKLASVPVRTMMLDETDKYPATFTREGSPMSLIEQRMKTYAGREKLIAASTPTLETGIIYQQFLLGDRREYWVPCAECGHMQPLTFKDVVFDNSPEASPAEIAQTARLKCRACGHLHTTAEKNDIVKHGHWEASCEPARANFVSFHLQSIASPWVSLEKLTEAFITAKRSGANELQTFVNSELAEPWHEEGEHLNGARLQSLEADYAEGGHFPGTDNLELRARFAGVDVQKNYLALCIREFAPGGSSGLVLNRQIQSFVELDDLCAEYGVTLCCIDARYRNDEVVAACANFADMVPCYGRAKCPDGTVFYTRSQTITHGRVQDGSELLHIFYDQSAVFEYVAEGLTGQRKWYLFKGATLDPTYCKEVTAKSKVAGIWCARSDVDDHYADAEKLCMLGALINHYLVPVFDGAE